MPDTETLGDAAADQLHEGATDSGTPPGEGTGTGEPKSYVASYRTREDAEKGIAEKEATIRRLQSERDKERADRERIERDVMAKLADAATSQREQPTRREPQAPDLNALKEQIRADPGNALEYMLAWTREAEQSAGKRTDEQTASLRKELAALSERIVTLSPEYQQNQKEIEAVRAVAGQDLSTAKALELVKALKTISAPSQPERDNPPGTTAAHVAPARETVRTLSQAEQALVQSWVGGNIDDAARQRIAKAARR